MNKAIYTTPNKEWEAYHAAWKCMGIILDNYYDSNANSTTDKSVINKRLKNTEDRTILRQQFLDECLTPALWTPVKHTVIKKSMAVTENAFKSSTFLDTKHLLW